MHMPMNMRYIMLFAAVGSVIVLTGGCVPQKSSPQKTAQSAPQKEAQSGTQEEEQGEEVYSPEIDPEDFSTTIDHVLFNLPVGRKMVYEAETEEGHERIVIEVTDDTKEIMGVTTLVYWDRVYLDDVLIEDTRDYIAQDTEGNVWYFGEDVDNYEGGVLKDHGGAWIAGVDGAQPGLWMEANPQVGDSYRQEYYVGVAEDMADVLSLSEEVSVPYGNFSDCLQTYDYSPLDPESKEYKYYCQEVGAMVLEEGVESGERVELVSIEEPTTIVE